MKKNKKTIMNIVVIMLVSVFSLTIGVTAATTISASQIVYNDTTVQAKVDELVDIANNKVTIDSETLVDIVNSVDPDTLQTNTAKTLYASSKGVCINRKGKLNCFKPNNIDVEKDHIQQVFSDANCGVSSSHAYCDDSDFICSFSLYYGDVGCSYFPDESTCDVQSDGYVECFNY